MDNINKQGILEFINAQPVKAVESIDLDKDKVKYSSKISSPRNLEVLPGGEEVVRAKDNHFYNADDVLQFKQRWSL